MLGPLAPRGLGPLAQAQGSALLALDTFTGANGALTAHTPDFSANGNGWASLLGNSLQISSNKAVGLAGGNNSNTIDVGRANVTASVDFTFATGANFIELIIRAQDSANWLFLVWSSPANTWRIAQFVASSTTVLGTSSTQALVNGQTYALKISASETSLNAYVDNALVVSATTSQFQTKTKCGLYINTTSGTFDNFRVTSP
jgi:hypothetical protein